MAVHAANDDSAFVLVMSGELPGDRRMGMDMASVEAEVVRRRHSAGFMTPQQENDAQDYAGKDQEAAARDEFFEEPEDHLSFRLLRLKPGW